MIRRLSLVALLLSAVTSGCVEDASTIATFDTTLESTTFENRLLAKVIVWRDGQVLDTIPARATRSYALGKTGPVRHSWRLIAPLDRFGKKAGVEPVVDLGVQYHINASYRLDNEGVPGKTMFAPMVANFTPYQLRLIANYREDDQVYTDYLIPADITTMLTNAPYFYWHGSSNVRLESTTTSNSYEISRQDTVESRNLKMDTGSEWEGTGRTIPRTVY